MINFYWHEAIAETYFQKRWGADDIPVVADRIILEAGSPDAIQRLSISIIH